MEIQQYISIKKDFQNLLIEYIDPDCDTEETFTKIIQYFENQKIFKDIYEFKEILNIISNFSDNHYRTIDFFIRIEQLLQYLKDQIQKQLTNEEIYQIFQFNKRILLFLIEEKILIPDQTIANSILNQPNTFNSLYFFKELSPFLKQESIEEINKKFEELSIDLNDVDSFEKKRKIGENDHHLCRLIREDSVIDFVTIYSRNSLNSESTIKESIFETNNFLITKKQKLTLIEYALFFGSIKIFNYLRFNNSELNEDSWLFAIHSNNPGIIHLLEENNIKPNINSILFESIKCHHYDITNYIENVKLDTSENDFIFISCLQFHNYELSFDMQIETILFLFCQFNYINAVKILLKDQKVDVDKRII